MRGGLCLFCKPSSVVSSPFGEKTDGHLSGAAVACGR